jgi:hypothetical protein
VATVLEYTTEEQRSVVRIFLWAKGLRSKDIHKEKFSAYGLKCLSRKAVHNWIENFSQWRLKVGNDARLGRPAEICTEATVQAG